MGALNEAEDDDIDVYDGGSVKQGRQRLAWESSEHEDDIRTVMGRSNKRTRRPPAEPVSVSTFFLRAMRN